jgi:hypothetical protein
VLPDGGGGGGARDATEDGVEQGRVLEDMSADADAEVRAYASADDSEDEKRAVNVDLEDAVEETVA